MTRGPKTTRAARERVRRFYDRTATEESRRLDGDPYRRLDDHGFFSAHQLSADNFATLGKYRIRFVYSTETADLGKWRVRDGKDRLPLEKLLDSVPKTTVTSNEIVVEVVKRK